MKLYFVDDIMGYDYHYPDPIQWFDTREEAVNYISAIKEELIDEDKVLVDEPDRLHYITNVLGSEATYDYRIFKCVDKFESEYSD